jgi:hypothetical protein
MKIKKLKKDYNLWNTENIAIEVQILVEKTDELIDWITEHERDQKKLWDLRFDMAQKLEKVKPSTEEKDCDHEFEVSQCDEGCGCDVLYISCKHCDFFQPAVGWSGCNKTITSPDYSKITSNIADWLYQNDKLEDYALRDELKADKDFQDFIKKILEERK